MDQKTLSAEEIQEEINKIKEKIRPNISATMAIGAAAVELVASENEEPIKRICRGTSKLYKVMFDALVDAGFSRDHAIMIVASQEPPFKPND